MRSDRVDGFEAPLRNRAMMLDPQADLRLAPNPEVGTLTVRGDYASDACETCGNAVRRLSQGQGHDSINIADPFLAVSVLAMSLLLLRATGWWNSAEGDTRVPGSDRCQGVNVRANAQLASVFNGHRAGTTYCLARGNYTITEKVLPHPGDRVVGAGHGATIIQAASGVNVMSAISIRTQPGSSRSSACRSAGRTGRATRTATARAGR